MSHHMVELIPLFCHEPTNYTEVFARKRFLIHEIDTACIPESTEGNLIRGYRLSFCWMQAPCTHTRLGVKDSQQGIPTHVTSLFFTQEFLAGISHAYHRLPGLLLSSSFDFVPLLFENKQVACCRDAIVHGVLEGCQSPWRAEGISLWRAGGMPEPAACWRDAKAHGVLEGSQSPGVPQLPSALFGEHPRQ